MALLVPRPGELHVPERACPCQTPAVSFERSAPVAKPLLYNFEDGSPILRYHFYPREGAHLREVDPAKTETRDKYVDAIAHRLVI